MKKYTHKNIVKKRTINQMPLVKVNLNRKEHAYDYATEWGLPLSINGGSKCEAISAVETSFSWEDMELASKTDVMSFIINYHSGINGNSTFAWLPTHSIEKQLKSYLLKTGKFTKQQLQKNVGHNVKKAWDLFQTVYEFESDPYVDRFIDEINKVDIGVRYGELTVGINDNLLSGFIFVHAFISKIGIEEYKDTYYGWRQKELETNNQISFGIPTELIKIYFHLVLEHQITVSPTGICHPHKYSGVSNLMQNRKDTDCPICNNKVHFDKSLLGLTTPMATRYIAELFHVKIKKAMTNSTYLKYPPKEFDDQVFGITILDGSKICVNYDTKTRTVKINNENQK